MRALKSREKVRAAIIDCLIALHLPTCPYVRRPRLPFVYHKAMEGLSRYDACASMRLCLRSHQSLLSMGRSAHWRLVTHKPSPHGEIQSPAGLSRDRPVSASLPSPRRAARSLRFRRTAPSSPEATRFTAACERMEQEEGATLTNAGQCAHEHSTIQMPEICFARVCSARRRSLNAQAEMLCARTHSKNLTRRDM